MKSLLDRFRPKVAIIEESKYINSMRLYELVSSIQTYDSTFKASKKEEKNIEMSCNITRDDWLTWLKELKRSWNSIKGFTKIKNLENEKGLMKNLLKKMIKVSPKIRKLNVLNMMV